MHRIIWFLVYGLIACSQLPAATVSTLVTDINASGDVSVGPDGYIYASHFGPKIRTSATGRHVLRISPAGDVNVYAKGFQGASGNAWDSQGNLYQSNIRGNRVDRIRPDGTVETFVDSIGGPVGIAVDAADNVFVNSCGANSVFRYEPDGSGAVFASHPEMSCPNGLTIDDDGVLYSANFNTGKIFRITPDGTAEVLTETPGGSFRSLGGNGHIVYANGRLYVASWAVNRIFEVELDGTIRPFAGDGSRGHQDGPAENARFSWPNGIGVSEDGSKLYISESESLNDDLFYLDFQLAPNRIRVIELDVSSEFSFNFGHSGSWYNPATGGQGLSLEVVPAPSAAEQDQLVAYWFTFAPDGSSETGGQRWFQGLGPITGDRAVMDVFQATGGIFDDPAAVDTQVVGTATMQVDNCTEGTLEYTLDLNGDATAETTGTIPLQRLTPDVLCQELSGADR